MNPPPGKLCPRNSIKAENKSSIGIKIRVVVDSMTDGIGVFL
jgi:hypothetical protein